MNAVLDTAIEIFRNGSERPSAAEIARRAGVSTSSFFRYFDGIDDLRMQVAQRFIEQHRGLLEPDVPEGLGARQRMELFVELRIQAGSILGPASRQLQGRAVDEPDLVPIQARARRILADQVESHFGPELDAFTPARRADLVAIIDSMSSIDAYRIMTDIHGRTDAQVRRAWLATLTALLDNA